MKKGKCEKIYGVTVYRSFEKKPVEARGIRKRSVVFRSGKEYDRKKLKRELRKWNTYKIV